MTKWEYHTETMYLSFGGRGPAVDKDDVTIAQRFAELGRDGWKLIAIYEGTAYFRRPLTNIPVQVGPSQYKEVPHV